MKKLTVVTICFQDLKGLQKTIASLLSQSVFEFEHWIIDGGSTDGTKNYLENLKVPWRLNWISEKDRGIYDAMNKGTQKATGDFIWYLNSGDYAADSAVIQDLRQQIQTHGDCALIYGKVYFESEYGLRPVGREVKKTDFKIGMPISHPGIIFNRDWALKFPYSTDFKIISDWLVIRKIFDSNAKTIYTNRFLTVFNLEGISSKNHWKDLSEKLKNEGSTFERLRLLLFCGGKYFFISLFKKMGIYSYFKRKQHQYLSTTNS